MTHDNEYILITEKKYLLVLLGLTTLVISNFLGHYISAFSIEVTPIVLPMIVGGLNFSLYKNNYYLTVLYGFGLWSLNDLMVRHFAGGTYDDEGKGWQLFFSKLAFYICALTMIGFAFRQSGVRGFIVKCVIVTSRILFVIVLAILIMYFYKNLLKTS